MNITTPVIDIECNGYRWHKFVIMLQCILSPVTCAFIAGSMLVVPVGFALALTASVIIS